MLNKLVNNNNLADTLTRWDAFWQRDVIDRPVVCITAPKSGGMRKGHNVSGASILRCESLGDLENLLKGYEEHLHSTAFLGESLPYLSIDFGPDTYASLFGGQIFPSADLPTTWVHPRVDRWSDFDATIDQSEGSNYQRLLNYLHYCAEYSEDKFLIAMIDSHSNLDTMSALRGPQDLCFDFMDYGHQYRCNAHRSFAYPCPHFYGATPVVYSFYRASFCRLA